ncbi:hypothetical protein AXF42_Ash001028 [Apostasia shenzhenica]|uniref:Uncharacterized protein n=1 Tax=Apostasia shenzhenica TaxID=1088818 RepID=A0A2I0ATQ8_9ASPA|nr:hypothetical protein AXF42_Ash001028 [Apostasia shenzhenica]
MKEQEEARSAAPVRELLRAEERRSFEVLPVGEPEPRAEERTRSSAVLLFTSHEPVRKKSGYWLGS